MVSAKFCHVVEGVCSVNIEADTYTARRTASIKLWFMAYLRRMLASDFVRKVAETFATRVFLIGIGLITSVIVARVLGPEGRGLYAVAAAIGAIGAQFGNLGLHASNTYYVAKDRSLLPALVGNTIVVSFAFGGGGAFAAWIVFSVWPDLAPVNGFLLFIALVWVPFGLAYMLLQNLLLGLQEVRTYNVIQLTTKILCVCLIALIIAFNLTGVETVFSAGLVSVLISFLWALWRLKPHLHKAPLPSFDLFKKNIRYGLKAYLAAFFAFLVLRIDLLMVKYMLGPEQAGYYSIAATMADMIYMLPVAIGTILFPKLSALADAGKKWEFTKKVSYVVGCLMLILVVVAVLPAEPVTGFLYGKAFLPAVPPFIWLMPAILLLSVNTVLMNYFASIGMPSIVVYSPGTATLLNIVLNIYLIPAWGCVGAAWSSIAAYGTMLIFSLLYIQYRTKHV